MPKRLLIFLAALLVAAAGCVRNQPEVIIITATFLPEPTPVALVPDQMPAPPIEQTLLANEPPANQTPDPARPGAVSAAREYVVQPGDTLSGIAVSYGTTIETLIQLNDIANPDALEVGQIIRLPDPPTETTSDFKILPDARVVFGPRATSFDIAGFIAQQPGFIRTATDTINDEDFTAAEVVERVAYEYSVDPRLLLALVELKAGWLSEPDPADEKKAYPIGIGDSPFGFTRRGLYRQLAWAADQINAGYYGWKHRGLSTLEFSGGIRLLYSPSLNAGTVALQFLLSQLSPYATWEREIGPDGLFAIYSRYFGNPFDGGAGEVIPPDLEQPPLGLPFPRGETWYYTGGPHGGWGTGSAWAAIDFAPPDDPATKTTACYVSDHFAVAVADGVVARTSEGAVVLDLDGDGDETTGWTILYLHLAEQDSVTEGTVLRQGDPVGRPSCEGGFSNGTHMHIARRYNGEWIPAYCESCAPGAQMPPFVMDGWMAVGLSNQEYQGYLMKEGQRKVAEQGRDIADNEVSW